VVFDGRCACDTLFYRYLNFFTEEILMKILFMFLVLTAVLLQIGGFIIYGIQVFSSASQPTAASWFLWSYLSALNAFTYHQDSGKDWSKSGVGIINAFAMISTFIFSIYVGGIGMPPPHDYPILIMGLLASWGWYRCGPWTAQIMLQIAFTIAFIPTYFDIWQNPLIEKPLPWIMWATSFFIGIIIVGMRWKGRFQEIMYPSIAFLRVAILITLLYWSAHLHSLILS